MFDQHWVGHANVFAIRGYPDQRGSQGGFTSADGMAAANRTAAARIPAAGSD